MKRKGIIALSVASLCLGVLSVGGAVTYAAFSTKKNLNRYTTVKHMVRLQATGEGVDFWNTSGAKTGIYIFNSTSGAAGPFANDGAFMDYLGDGIYTSTLPPIKDSSGNTVYDHIIFVRCKDTATTANWSDMWNQTNNIPYSENFTAFIIYATTYGTDADVYKDGDKFGGKTTNSVTTYSYSAA